MQLLIKPTQKIKEVQENFQKHFPFLKIEFFEPGKPVNPNNMADYNLKIGQRGIQREFAIGPEMKVIEVENALNELSGLNAEIFRKSGKVWLQTSSTDQWTLEQQNHEGQEADKIINETPEENDYHEQE